MYLDINPWSDIWQHFLSFHSLPFHPNSFLQCTKAFWFYVVLFVCYIPKHEEPLQNSRSSFTMSSCLRTAKQESLIGTPGALYIIQATNISLAREIPMYLICSQADLLQQLQETPSLDFLCWSCHSFCLQESEIQILFVLLFIRISRLVDIH